MTDGPRLAIVVVNYNSGYRLEQGLDALRDHPPSCGYEVVVVDNASVDGSANFLRTEPRAGVTLVSSPINLLFTGGVNLAFSQSRGEFFMIMNPDMVPNEGAFDAMVRHLDDDPALGAVAGYTMRPDGTYEKYVGRFPTPLEVFIGNYFGTRAKRGWLLRKFQYGLEAEDFSRAVEAPNPAGGCLMFRRGLVNGLPMGGEFGVFWSDADLAQNIRASGRRIMVFPDAPFIHDHNPESRRVHDEASLSLVLDYLVGCEAYFRRHGAPWDAWKTRLLFASGAAASLFAKHLPKAIAGRESWGMWRARARVLTDFWYRRNRLLMATQGQAKTGRDSNISVS